MTELREEPYVIPAADLGPENPLPQFRSTLRRRPPRISASVGEEDRRYMGWQTARRILPYRLQDGFNRDRKPRAFRSFVLENEYLRVTVLPELGGRIAALTHKPTGRELIDRNPVFQPANLALRDAWISGGIEWNTCQPGHYYLTCSPVFAARVEAPDGSPALRIYEWDRVKCFPWQVDLILPHDSPFLFARVRLVNPHGRMIPMYWWTNMSVAEKPDVRVIAPAGKAIHGSAEGISTADLPTADGIDLTYATNSQRAREIFFRIPDGERRWEAALDGDGRGIFEASTRLLRGRKMFTWGMGRGGRWWQQFLSEPGRAYIEIQAGLARTQLECLPMPARAEWEWTEAFGLLEADPKKVHSGDWTEAWTSVGAAVENVLPEARLDELHEAFECVTRQTPGEVLAAGSGWGALERKRLAYQKRQDRIPPELVFDDSTLGSEQEPWLKLLYDGALPETDPNEDPMQGMVQPEWRKLVEKNLADGRGSHWLAWLHLGNMLYESRRHSAACEAWQRSCELRPNGWALRNLAVAAMRRRNGGAAAELMNQAWETGPKTRALAVEYARLLSALNRFEDLRRFEAALPEDIRSNERIAIMCARAALVANDFGYLEEFFKREFTSIREGELTLTDLWFKYQTKRLAAQEGVPVTEALKERVRRECPPPAHIDFRMR